MLYFVMLLPCAGHVDGAIGAVGNVAWACYADVLCVGCVEQRM